MKIIARRLKLSAIGFLLTLGLSACLVPDGGVYVGGGYAPAGYDYGGWGPGYRVGPSRGGGHRRVEQAPVRAYRPAPRSRPVPSIPNRPHQR